MPVTFRTNACQRFAHPEFTIQFTQPSPIPGVERMLLEYLERSVEHGTRFSPGQTIRLGWATLRLCARSDATIGVQERELTPAVAWTESVDRALRNTWYQREIVDSVGLLREIDFPSHDDGVLLADCASNATAVVMTRLPADDGTRGFSGWSIACAEEHDHGERFVVPLLAVAAKQPALVQLLALPRGTVVLAMFRAKSGVPPELLRIEPHVYLGDEEIEPKPGSYLAALQAD
jgi:hypothetical protein